MKQNPINQPNSNISLANRQQLLQQQQQQLLQQQQLQQEQALKNLKNQSNPLLNGNNNIINGLLNKPLQQNTTTTTTTTTSSSSLNSNNINKPITSQLPQSSSYNNLMSTPPVNKQQSRPALPSLPSPPPTKQPIPNISSKQQSNSLIPPPQQSTTSTNKTKSNSLIPPTNNSNSSGNITSFNNSRPTNTPLTTTATSSGMNGKTDYHHSHLQQQPIKPITTKTTTQNTKTTIKDDITINNIENFINANNGSNNTTTVTPTTSTQFNPSNIINNIKQQQSLEMLQQKQLEDMKNLQNQQLDQLKTQQKKLQNPTDSDFDEYDDDDDENMNLSPRTLRELKNIQRLKSLEKFSPSYLTNKKLVPLIKQLPKFPEWSKERPFLNYGYLSNISTKYSNTSTKDSNIILPAKYEKTKVQLSSFPNYFREQILIEDLLSAMIGIEGECIHISLAHETEDDSLQSNFIHFIIEGGEVDPSSNDLIQRILPLCSYYSFVCDFIQIRYAYEWGIINHSLCFSIDQLLKEYLILVSQLEGQLKSEKLSLQRMWFYLQPTITTFEILYKVTSEIMRNNCHGAQVLNLLLRLQSQYSSDKKSQDLFYYLIKVTTVPFLEMLNLWVHQGVICDPYFEFMIEENLELKRDNINRDFNDIYWEKRYQIRKDQIPKYLDSISLKILTTGKYLNVVKECSGKDYNGGNGGEDTVNSIEFSRNDKVYIDKIEKAYDYASGILLNLLVNDRQLISRLKAIKHYFLLCKGDFFSHFMDITYDELKKPLDEINMVKMNSLLQLSLRTSSISEEDEFKDDLECEFIQYKLSDQLLGIININDHGGNNNISPATTTTSKSSISNNLTNNSTSTTTTTSTLITSHSAHDTLKTNKLFGIESLAFNYNVGWPLSLIISRKSLIKYQIIFRHLFLCKHVEKVLVDTWSQRQVRRRNYNKAGLSTLLSFTHLLRHRMIHFLQNLEYYMMLEVLEPNWNKMKNAIKTSKTVDDVIRIHNDFLETCLTECMLTDTKLVTILMKFMSLCIRFANFTNDMMLDDNVIDTEQIKKTIDSSEHKFHTILKLLMDTLKSFSTIESNRHMIHLIHRLDYNNYYSNYFENNSHLFNKKVNSSTNSSTSSSINNNKQQTQQQQAQQQQMQQNLNSQQQQAQQQQIQQNLYMQYQQQMQQQNQQAQLNTRGSTLPSNYNIPIQQQQPSQHQQTINTATTTTNSIVDELRRKSNAIIENNSKKNNLERPNLSLDNNNIPTDNPAYEYSQKLRNLRSQINN